MNKEIIEPLRTLLKEMHKLLLTLDDRQYGTPIAILSDVSLAQHTRHIIEFIAELMKGYETGYVNYDSRKRDKRIEQDRIIACTELINIMEQLDKKDKVLWLVTNYNPSRQLSHNVTTNYERELIHNLEHIIHHMALMRIGVTVISDKSLPETFGVALSTVRYRNGQMAG